MQYVYSAVTAKMSNSANVSQNLAMSLNIRIFALSLRLRGITKIRPRRQKGTIIAFDSAKPIKSAMVLKNPSNTKQIQNTMLTDFKQVCKMINGNCCIKDIMDLQRNELTSIARKAFSMTDEEIRMVYDDVFGYSVKLK